MFKFTSVDPKNRHNGDFDCLNGRLLQTGDVIRITWNDSKTSIHNVRVEENWMNFENGDSWTESRAFIEIDFCGNVIKFRPSQVENLKGEFVEEWEDDHPKQMPL